MNCTNCLAPFPTHKMCPEKPTEGCVECQLRTELHDKACNERALMSAALTQQSELDELIAENEKLRNELAGIDSVFESDRQDFWNYVENHLRDYSVFLSNDKHTRQPKTLWPKIDAKIKEIDSLVDGMNGKGNKS